MSVSHVLRVPRQRNPVSRRRAVCCAASSGWTTSPTKWRGRRSGPVPDTDAEDLLLLDDLLGIRDPACRRRTSTPDARRRRLTALVNAASLARPTPAVYVIEDAHWIDEVSESMLADFLSVVPQTRSLVLITYRPEYRGASVRTRRADDFACPAG